MPLSARRRNVAATCGTTELPHLVQRALEVLVQDHLRELALHLRSARGAGRLKRRAGGLKRRQRAGSRGASGRDQEAMRHARAGNEGRSGRRDPQRGGPHQLLRQLDEAHDVRDLHAGVRLDEADEVLLLVRRGGGGRAVATPQFRSPSLPSATCRRRSQLRAAPALPREQRPARERSGRAQLGAAHKQVVVERLEVSVDDGVLPELRLVAREGVLKVLEGAVGGGGGDGAHGVEVRPLVLQAALAVDEAGDVGGVAGHHLRGRASAWAREEGGFSAQPAEGDEIRGFAETPRLALAVAAERDEGAEQQAAGRQAATSLRHPPPRLAEEHVLERRLRLRVIERLQLLERLEEVGVGGLVVLLLCVENPRLQVDLRLDALFAHTRRFARA